MHDAKVISACVVSRDAYDKVQPYVDVSEFTPHAAFWWKQLVDWYKLGGDSVDLELLEAKGKRAASPKHWDASQDFLRNLPKSPSPDNAVLELIEVKRHNTGMELASVLAAGGQRHTAVKQLLEEYSELLDATNLDVSVIQRAGSVAEAGDILSDENRISLVPGVLNDRLNGGPFRGDFVVIIGYLEGGKTLFSVAHVAHWLRQDLRVLYIGNEDKKEKILARVRNNLANMTDEDYAKWPDEAIKRAQAAGIDERLFLYHLHPGTVDEIEALVKEHEPDVLVLDQIRNLGGGGDGLTGRMNQNSINFRQILSKYNVLGWGVAQAYPGERGKERKVWMDTDDAESSRTGLGAQADLFMALGQNEKMKNKNQLAVSLCKNKVSGNHQGVMIQYDPLRSRVI